MNQNNAVVAICQSHAEADAAVKELQHSDFAMRKLSIVGRDIHTEEHVVITRGRWKGWSGVCFASNRRMW